MIIGVIAPGNCSTPDATGWAGIVICCSCLGGSGASSFGAFATGTVIFALSGSSAFRGGSGVLLPPPPPPPPGPGCAIHTMSLSDIDGLTVGSRHDRQRDDEEEEEREHDVRDERHAERVAKAHRVALAVSTEPASKRAFGLAPW